MADHESGDDFGDHRTPVHAVHAWTPDLERTEKRLRREIEAAHQRHSDRIGGVEDEATQLRRELVDMRTDIVNIQGKDGRGGILAALGGKIDSLCESQEDAATKHQEAQREASREGAANRRTFIGVAVTLILFIIGGVLVMRDRLTSVEHDVEGLREQTRRIAPPAPTP